MKLYVCYGDWKQPILGHKHPCGEAHQALLGQLGELVVEMKVDTSRVTFEVTESVLMENSRRVYEVLEGLRDMGFTGSLNYGDCAAMLQALSPGFLEGLKLQPDPQLHPGSVRLRLDDTVLDDLVDHRLQALVDKLLVHTGPRESVLLRDAPSPAQPLAAGFASQGGGMSAGPGGLAGQGGAGGLAGGSRRRPAGLGDVIDATARPMPDTPPPAEGSE